MPWFRAVVCTLLGVAFVSGGPALVRPLTAAEPAELLQIIKAVGPEGQGNAAASAALQELLKHDAAVLPTVLEAFDDANPLAANWMRSAVETIADRTLRGGKRLPTAELERFALDADRNPRARRLAYEWLVKVDPHAVDRLIPGMLHDPSSEFRRDAVQRLIAEAEQLSKAGKPAEAKQVYNTALSGATEEDLVKAIIKPLKAMGETVNLPQHFGFVTEWSVVGPFDNRGNVGFDAVYPPEEHAEMQASYAGQLGHVSWQVLKTEHDYGLFDIAKLLENYKGAAMYCRAEFYSDTARPVEFRLGTPNSWKIFLNGDFLFGRIEYHRGMAIDQYRVPATLKPGKNVILLKICQNEQSEDWAQRYQFQFRVCDANGQAVHSTKSSGRKPSGGRGP